MKISRRQLRRIIKEELSRALLKEQEQDGTGFPNPERDPPEGEIHLGRYGVQPESEVFSLPRTAAPLMPSGGPVFRMGEFEVRTDSSFTDEDLDQIRRFLVEMKKMIASAGRYEGGGQFWMDRKGATAVERRGQLEDWDSIPVVLLRDAKGLWRKLKLPRDGKLVIIYSPGPR